MDRLAGMGEKAVPALAALAADGGAPTMARRNALRALGRTRRAEAAGPVRAALGEGDRRLRLSAFQAAGELARALGDSKEAADRERGRELAAALAAAREGEADPLVRRMR
jgi:hypothetical protein